MDKNTQDLLETVIFIKDYIVDNLATKDEVHEIVNEAVGGLREEIFKEIKDFRDEIKGEFMGIKSRIGAIDNRIDNEVFARRDLENRVRIVLPTLPISSERV